MSVKICCTIVRHSADWFAGCFPFLNRITIISKARLTLLAFTVAHGLGMLAFPDLGVE